MGFTHFVVALICRLDLNHPPTAVGGIRLLGQIVEWQNQTLADCAGARVGLRQWLGKHGGDEIVQAGVGAIVKVFVDIR